MSLLTVKKKVFSLLNLDMDLVPDGSADPEPYSQAQILAAINSVYGQIAANTLCIDGVETITASGTDAIYASAFPTGYLDTKFMTTYSSKEPMHRVNYMDFYLLSNSSDRYYTQYNNAINIFDATSASGNKYRHTYSQMPTELVADADVLIFPLNNWERLIALGVALDLIIKDTTQTAQIKKVDVKVLYDETFAKFEAYQSNVEASQQGYYTQTTFVNGDN